MNTPGDFLRHRPTLRCYSLRIDTLNRKLLENQWGKV